VKIQRREEDESKVECLYDCIEVNFLEADANSSVLRPRPATTDKDKEQDDEIIDCAVSVTLLAFTGNTAGSMSSVR
jgi:hypothetical protein